MPQIEKPYDSRPLDVHRWSDHPEVKGMVDELWEGGLREHFEGKTRDGRAKPGPKAEPCTVQPLVYEEQVEFRRFTPQAMLRLRGSKPTWMCSWAAGRLPEPPFLEISPS